MSFFAFDHKPIISGMLLFVVMAGLILPPIIVRATVPVIDPSEIAKIVELIGNAIKQLAELVFQSGQLVSLNTYFYVLKPAVKFLASLILQALTQNIVKWIQNGGNTNFITNLKAALTDAADQAAGEFLNQIAGANLCAPFADPLRGIFRVPMYSLGARLSCSATDIFQNLQTSYQNFLSDFTQGGWIAFQATLNGNNNYIDALITSVDAKLSAESQRVQITQARYDAGNGFIGVNVKKEDCSDGFVDENGNPLCGTVDVQTTPGHLVSDLLSKSVGSGIDNSVNINDIGQALDAIISALINKLITSAQAGLLANNEQSGLYDSGLANLPPPGPPPADLIISAGPTLDQPNALAGDMVTFSAVVKNQGSADVNTSFSVRFQIDVGNDGTIDQTLAPDATINGLRVGEQKTVTSTLWTAVAGTHRVIVCADPGGVVPEALKTNNCSLGDTGVFTIGPRPDLIVSGNPAIYAGEPIAGQSITFFGIIKNQGGATATSTFQNRFQIDLNNDGTIDTTLIGPAIAPYPIIANLAPGATQVIFSPPWIAIEGTHRVILCADEPSEVIIETDKSNNCSPAGTGIFTIQPPNQQ